jgi:5'-deoxynucleotidase YfbR-like HD superfamily hydrolase
VRRPAPAVGDREMSNASGDRRGPWVQTASGGRFYVLDPRADEVRIEDIAHALSHVCRYGGHVRTFYSVAQHCYLVSYLVPQRLALWGLMHDAAEAYVGDVVQPLKVALRARAASYDEIEHQVELVIAQRFRLHTLSSHDQQIVKHADIVALATERRDLMGPIPGDWEIDAREDVQPDEDELTPWSPAGARRQFLDRFAELCTRDRA